MQLSTGDQGVEGVTELTQSTTSQQCAGCKQRIKDRFLLKALDNYWHEDCLKCSCCDCRLGEVGSTLFAKANLVLCRRDYLRLFGSTGNCSVCKKTIPAFELVMRAKTHVYHLECFACQQCNHRFCVGDRFYLCDNKILCEYDYEERMIFASMQSFNTGSTSTAGNGPNGTGNNNNGSGNNFNGSGNNFNGTGNNNNATGNNFLGTGTNFNGTGNNISGTGSSLTGTGNNFNTTGNTMSGTGHGLAGGGAGGYNALSRIKQQTESLSDSSSGYNSPSPGSL